MPQSANARVSVRSLLPSVTRDSCHLRVDERRTSLTAIALRRSFFFGDDLTDEAWAKAFDAQLHANEIHTLKSEIAALQAKLSEMTR